MEVAAVVVPKGLVNLEDRLGAGGIGDVGVDLRGSIARDSGSIIARAGVVGVVDEKKAVGGVVGMERESQEALLVANVVDKF